MTDYNLTVSVKHEGIPPLLDVVQGDSGRNIVITVADMDITDCIARVYVVKPSGLDVYNEAVVSDGAVAVGLTAQMLAEHGNTKMQISIYKGGAERVSTFAVYLNVAESLQDTGHINSSTEYKTLDGLIEQALGVVDEGTAKLDKWMLEKDGEYDEWTAQRKAEYDTWTAEKRQAWLQWAESFETSYAGDFEAWYRAFKTANENDFTAWFTELRNTLDENQAAGLHNRIDTHDRKGVGSEDGVHGLRLSDNRLQVNTGTGWVTLMNVPVSMTAEYFNSLNMTVTQFNEKQYTVEEFNKTIMSEVV